MLHCNVSVEKGLVNGALGTVQAISETRITVKFDRITDPCEIEKVKRKFMVMKNVFVYRSQFPLILAFAVTIHNRDCHWIMQSLICLSMYLVQEWHTLLYHEYKHCLGYI